MKKNKKDDDKDSYGSKRNSIWPTIIQRKCVALKKQDATIDGDLTKQILGPKQTPNETMIQNKEGSSRGNRVDKAPTAANHCIEGRNEHVYFILISLIFSRFTTELFAG